MKLIWERLEWPNFTFDEVVILSRQPMLQVWTKQFSTVKNPAFYSLLPDTESTAICLPVC